MPLAKYVTTKLGNIYPHLPIVTESMDAVHYPIGPLDLITTYTSDEDGGNLSLNITGDFQTSNVTLSANGDGDPSTTTQVVRMIWILPPLLTLLSQI